MDMDNKIMRRPAVLAACGISSTTMYRLLKAGDFPAPHRLGLRAVGWKESDVMAWVNGRAKKGQSEEQAHE